MGGCGEWVWVRQCSLCSVFSSTRARGLGLCNRYDGICRHRSGVNEPLAPPQQLLNPLLPLAPPLPDRRHFVVRWRKERGWGALRIRQRTEKRAEIMLELMW